MIPNSEWQELRVHETSSWTLPRLTPSEFVRVTDSANETVTSELRFVCHSPVDGRPALVENYMRKIGTSDKSIRPASHQLRQQAQMELGGEGEPEQAALEVCQMARALTAIMGYPCGR